MLDLESKNRGAANFVIIFVIIITVVVVGFVAINKISLFSTPSPTSTPTPAPVSTPTPTAIPDPEGVGGQIFEQVQNPGENLPDTNPLEQGSNPFSETETNPFKIYQNPFE